MLLTGTYQRTLDDKKRLVLPKKVREALGDPGSLFVAPGPDKCLWVHTNGELERLAARLDERPATDAEARLFRRLFFAQAESVDVDRAGRILLPDRLVQSVGIEHEVVLVGVRDHLEVWDAGQWDAYLRRHESRFDQVAEEAFAPPLRGPSTPE
ncbi:MAG: division/cell wall cluster transcriptional repressor MraZ [Gemmataceae bacterium]|jgi:MraZ protein|nr:division/cell wall cluster transcriptional repressor MraZ [Planctomycetota bacterium]NBU76436.1 division/cell wall cluster transcriptional repressor MraZ [Planctomycetota bacterium]